jgi:hypothetical protein
MKKMKKMLAKDFRKRYDNNDMCASFERANIYD